MTIDRQLFASIVCVSLLAPLGGAFAAGLYDGEWNGIATPNRGRCNAARVTLTVAGKVALGEASLQGQKLDIRGTVYEDGSFGATIGFRSLQGRFNRDAFEGGFESADCQWKVTLGRTK